jgi:hypothetical protein
MLAVGANTPGEVAVLYDGCDATCGNDGAPLEMVIRAAGSSRFGAPITVMPAPGGYGGPSNGSVTVAADGTVLVAWNQDVPSSAVHDTIFARLVLPSGTLTPAVEVARPALDNTFGAIDTAIAPNGDPVVAYENDPHDMACKAAKDIVTVGAAVGDPQGAFGDTQQLARFGPAPWCQSRAADTGSRFTSSVIGLVDDPQPLVVWTGSQSGRLQVDAAVASNGRFGPMRRVSPPDGSDNFLAAVAPGRGAGATVLWQSGSPSAQDMGEPSVGELLAATASHGDAFGSPQLVAPVEPLSFPSSLAVDPVTGRALAVWSTDSKLEYAIRNP